MKDKTRIHELDAIKDWPLLGCKRYRGAVVWKNFKDGTYNIWRYKNLSAEQVDRKIDNSLMALGKSIGSND